MPGGHVAADMRAVLVGTHEAAGAKFECDGKQADRIAAKLKLTVDTGLDTRTVVSGIAEHFAPEDVVGRQVTLLINLAPRKLRGIESQGMVLMAGTDDGGLRFVTPEEGVAPGQACVFYHPDGSRILGGGWITQRVAAVSTS